MTTFVTLTPTQSRDMIMVVMSVVMDKMDIMMNMVVDMMNKMNIMMNMVVDMMNKMNIMMNMVVDMMNKMNMVVDMIVVTEPDLDLLHLTSFITSSSHTAVPGQDMATH